MLRRAATDIDAVALEVCTHVGRLQRAVDLGIQLPDDNRGCPGRTAKPTPLATDVSVVARELFARLPAFRARPVTMVAGRVRLGAIATVQTDVLPQALRVLQDRHPALDVQVSPNDSDALQLELKSGRIDVAALIRPQSGGSSRLLWQNLPASRTSCWYLRMRLPARRRSCCCGGVIRYDTSLTSGRIAAKYVQRIAPRVRCAMEMRSIDAIVGMVSAGLGVAIVPQPRRPLLDAHAVRAVRLGKGSPTRQIAVVRRRADADDRNIDAVFRAFAAAYATGGP